MQTNITKMMHEDSVLYTALAYFTIQKVTAYSPCLLLLLLFISIKYRVQIKV